jgi:putative ABC transport system permease protein
MLLLKLPWRNIWRNKRRTYISSSAIIFAVIIAIFSNSFQTGVWDYAIDSLVRTHVGHIQLHTNGYWDSQEMDMAFEWSDELHQKLSQLPAALAAAARLEGFAMAYNYNDTSSKPALIKGVEAEREIELSQLNEQIVEGEYLKKGDPSVLLAIGLAERMQLQIGDTITLISSGYHGANAAGRYPIKGFVKFGNPELNKRLIYMNLELAQDFFAASGLATSAVVLLKGRSYVDKAVELGQSQFDSSKYELMSWESLIPEIVQARELKLSGNVIILAVIYLIIGFGIWGTILMMTKERQYEFGVLTAIGMKRNQLAATIWLETSMLGLLGAIIGILISIPLVSYFHYYPITFSGEMAETYEKFGMEPYLPTALDPSIFLTQTFVVLIVTSFLALYPILKIMRMRPIKAMRTA